MSDSQPEQPQSEPKQPTNPSAAPTSDQSSRGSRMHFPAMGQGSMSEKDEKTWAMLGHISSLAGIFILPGIGYVLGPLAVYLLKKGESPYVDEHSRETLNFSIITAIVIIVSAAAGVAACFAWCITATAAIANLIFCIQGSLAAKNGEAYRYPFNLRLIK